MNPNHKMAWTVMIPALCLVLVIVGVSAASSVSVPNTFTGGTPAVAAEVNANFSAVENAINDNDSRVTALEGALGGLAAGCLGGVATKLLFDAVWPGLSAELGVGPEELGLNKLEDLLGEGQVKELIIATNPTVEGEATAYYLQEMARARSIQVSRIAHGVPLGGELEYIDQSTLAMAFTTRKSLNEVLE